MRAKGSVYIATSLDGFIAKEDGGLDWLDAASETVREGEDCGYAEFFNSIDVLVMGRKTYEKVLSFGAWPYGDKRVVVMSQRPIDFQDRDEDSDLVPACVTRSSENPTTLVARLTAEGAKHLYVDGGQTIQRFLAADLIDEMTITVIPILLGKGIPLFSSCGREIPLTHLSTQSYDWGFVQSRYAVGSLEGEIE